MNYKHYQRRATLLGKKPHISSNAVYYAGPDPIISVECHVWMANALPAVLRKIL